MKPKQIIIWGGWYGSKNVGDQALLLAITDILGNTYPDARFIVLTSNAAHVHAYTSRDSPLHIRALNTRKQFGKVIRAFRKSDLFVFGGAVPFFDHRPQVITMSVLVALARLFRTPYFLWSVSSQPVKSNLSKKVFGWVLRGADGITCRDTFTAQLFKDCGIAAHKVSITGDSVILMRTDPEEDAIGMLTRAGWIRAGRPLVALTPRTLRPADGEAQTHYTPQSSTQFQQEIDHYAVALDWLWEHGYQPLFVPMNTVSPDDDRLAARKIMDQAKHGNKAMIIDEEIYPRRAAAVYRQCRLSLVSRVHGSILSFKAGCPVIMYAFDQKHVGIMEALGLSDCIFRPGVQTAEDLTGCISDILKDEARVRDQIAHLLEISAQQSIMPFHYASAILEKGKSMNGAESAM